MPEEVSQTFHVEGMHCASCVLFLEETLLGKFGVTSVCADLNARTVVVSGSFFEEPNILAKKLSELLVEGGYKLSCEKGGEKKNYREFIVAIPAALVFLFAFFLLQKLGLVQLVGQGGVTYATALLIGLIASVSTCLALVGGLVLSLSASSAKQNGKPFAQALFHFGRLGGFFILGGVIGTMGKFFQLGILGTGILGMFVALVMLVLGIHLLDIFPESHRFLPRMPRIFARQTKILSVSSHVLSPVLVGVGTFFLPCGFTQSMQLYTLSTGNFFTGAFTMFFFALGTFPVLAALSFGSFTIAHKPWKGVFFKVAGIVVLTLALFNLWNACVTLGLIPFSFFS